MKILGIGQSVYDLFFPLPADLSTNEKRRIYDAKKRLGGPVTNAMSACGLWGLNPYIMTRIGDDAMGHDLLDQMRQLGLDTSTMGIDPKMETTVSCILVYPDGNRVVLNIPSIVTSQNLKLDWPKTVDIILFDGHEIQWSLEAMKRYPNAITVFDGDKYKPETKELLSNVDYLIGGLEFAQEITGHPYDLHTYQELCSINNNHVILTMGENGCLYKDKQYSAYPAQVVDTTGAGDVFHGAFVYGLAKQWDLDTIIRFSNVAAGLATEKVGVRDAIASTETILKHV